MYGEVLVELEAVLEGFVYLISHLVWQSDGPCAVPT